MSDDLTRIVCVADEDLTAPPLAAVTTAPAAAATARVNGTRFPLDPRQTYTVPLWSPATELPTAELLATATICYRSPGCSVTFVAPALAAARGR